VKEPLLIITGPTAVGKTALSIEIAKRLNGEIISADSMQVYKYMNIGTAKIKKDEMQGVVHHLIDVYEPTVDYNVYQFKEDVTKCMKDIRERGKLPILVGGTGFYIQAILYDIDFTENETKSSLRCELEKMAEEKGAHEMHELLWSVDKEAANQIHENNVKRVIRAIEFNRLTGQKISEHNMEQREKSSPYNFLYFVLNRSRQDLYKDIDRRVDCMMEQGLLEEVQELCKMGLSKDNVSMQGIGYKEVLQYLEGEITFEEAVRIIKRDTRHFAKRQITWFKREKEVLWLDKDEERTESIADLICQMAKDNKLIERQ